MWRWSLVILTSTLLLANINVIGSALGFPERFGSRTPNTSTPSRRHASPRATAAMLLTLHTANTAAPPANPQRPMPLGVRRNSPGGPVPFRRAWRRCRSASLSFNRLNALFLHGNSLQVPLEPQLVRERLFIPDVVYAVRDRERIALATQGSVQ